MDPIAVAVVSDIHAGPDNEYDELRVPSTAKTGFSGASFSCEVLGEAFEEMLADVPDERRVLVCCGDLTAECHSQELERAGAFLESLAARLRVPEGARALVPGNHDIDWTITNLAVDDPWYDRLAQQKFEEVLGEEAPTFAFPRRGEPVLLGCLSGELLLCLLDSPHMDRAEPPGDRPHHGRLGEKQRSLLRQKLSASPYTDAVTLAVLHHHVEQLGEDDFSLLQDVSELKRELSDSSIDFILHGHQHKPRLLRTAIGGRDVPVLACGSSTVHPRRLARMEANSIHVVLLEERSPTGVQGTVLSKVLARASGWSPAHLDHHGIAHRHRFGADVTETTLHTWAEEAIAYCESEKLLRLGSFLQRKPQGEFVCVHRFAELVRKKINKEGHLLEVSNFGETAVQLQVRP